MGIKKHSPQGADPSIKSGKSLISMRGPFQMKGSPYSMKSPLEGNAFVGAKVAAEKAGKDSFQVDGKSFPVQMKGTPMYNYSSDAQRKAVHASKADGGKGAPTNNYGKIVPQMKGDPNKRMDKLSDKHKKLYDRFEMGQTSYAEEARMHRLEDRMDKVGKRIKKKPKAKTIKKSPLNQGKRRSRPDVSTLGEKEFENKLRKERRLPGFAERPGDTQLQESAKKRNSDPDYKKPKAKTLKKSPVNQGKKIKKAKKTQAQIDKIRNSFGTKNADVSGRFERKRKKMDKTVNQLEKKGVYVDFDTTGPEGEGASRKTTKKTTKKIAGGSPMNQGMVSKTRLHQNIGHTTLASKPKGNMKGLKKKKKPVQKSELSTQYKKEKYYAKKSYTALGGSRLRDFKPMPAKDSGVKHSPVNQGVELQTPLPKPKKKIIKNVGKRVAKAVVTKKIQQKIKPKIKSSPFNKTKEERKAKRAKRREETGGTRVGNAIRKGKEVVEKVKNSKVGKVASGIVETVSNVKKGKIAAAIKSGKQTVADAKEKKVKKS